VPYPYEKTTVVQGFAGMEYPMMANDESYADTVFSRFVAEHEIAHTYFPFYMGINETRYGFMDEGWATTFEYLIGSADLGKEHATEFYKQFRVNDWASDPSPLEDLPIITPEDVLKNQAYGNNAYGKPSLGYLALKDLLGDSTFKRALHGFMDRWHGKHPIPWDFFNTVNDVTGQDLNWFFKAWYFDNSYIDVAVRGVTPSPNGASVTLEHIGGMPLFRLRTVRPKGYPVPVDGPCGELLRAQDRHPWRPAHIHFMLSRDGYRTLVTQVFDNEDGSIESDVVFGVTPSLAGRFERRANGSLHLDYDFVMQPGTRRIPRPPLP